MSALLSRIWQSPWLKGHIGRRMAVLIILFSTLITVIVSAIQLGLEYRTLRNGVERQLDEITVYIDNISGSVWTFDERQITTALEGLRRLPNIEKATITLTDESYTWTVGDADAKSHLIRLYPLIVGQDKAVIGQLQVIASLDDVNRRILFHALTILLSNFVTILCVALFMLYLFRRMVTMRLDAITSKVKNLGPELFPTFAPSETQSQVVPNHLDELASVDWVIDRTAEELKRTAEERQRTEEEILVLNRSLQALLDAAFEVSIIATDANGLITVINRGAENMLGYQASELIGQSPALIHRASDIKLRARELSKILGRPVDGFEVFVATIRTGGTDTRNWTYVRKDGSTLRVSLSVSAVLDKAGTLIGFLGIARDITQQLAAEAELIKMNLQLENRVRERTEALQESTEQLQVTLDDLRQTQQQLVQAEKLSSLGSLVAGMAHELNTPIGVCLTTASTMHDMTVEFEGDITAGKLRKSSLENYLSSSIRAMDLLVRGLSRCAGLVANFKQVAANSQGMDRRRFSLDEMLASQLTVLRASAPEQHRQIELLCPPGIAMNTFAEALEQIVAHMVSNALTHAFAGKATGELRLEVTDMDDKVQLDFQDDGCGMSEEIRAHVFDPFFTTQMGKGGSGLGMYIAYNLATGPLGGSLAVRSQPGAGTTFTLLLPKQPA